MTEHTKEMTAAQMLYEARTSGRRKREINTISKLLCIREEYLVALENGDYRQIPELVYILGFARNYSMELGLDPDEIVAKIKKEMGLAAEDDAGPAEPKEEPAAAPKPAEPNISVKHAGKPKKIAKFSFFSKIPRFVYKNWKWLAAAIVALVLVIVGISLIVSAGTNAPSARPVESAAAVPAEPIYKMDVRERFGTENRANAKIILQATQETWVKIEDARGNTVFSRVLVPGDIYYVPDGDKYKGTFGNAGGIDVWVNGVLAPKLGAPNTRKTGVLMTADNLAASADEAPATE